MPSNQLPSSAISPTLTTNGSPTLLTRLGVFSIPSSLSWPQAVASGPPTVGIASRPCARLGAKSITALVVPEREVAWQILALNTEKAHNLKERSLEVIRIYRGLVDEDGSRPESGFAFYLDHAALVTLGVCYERVVRFGGGAYHPILRRLEDFSDDALRSALKHHEKRASMVLDLEEKVAAVVKKLKERGLVSPYLRSFVVARINPLRWIKGDAPPLEDVLKTMRERVAKFNVEKISPQDLAGAAGPPDEEP
jgi:ParB family chromosome partitioning protein